MTLGEPIVAVAMTYEDFLAEVIRKGKEGAKESYKQPRNLPKLLGSIAGFEACAGKSPAEIQELLKRERRMTEIFRHGHTSRYEPDVYWRQRCKEAEIEWTWSCVVVWHDFMRKPLAGTDNLRSVRVMLLVSEILGLISRDPVTNEIVPAARA